MSSFELIDMSAVPVPDIIEDLDFETRFERLKAGLVALDPAYAELVELESDPAVKLLQLAAYHEMLLAGKVNDATRANMLASAQRNDLTALASRYNIQRLIVTPADPDATPPTPAIMESDPALRRRVQMAFDGLNTAGSIDGYVFHALGVDGRVKDVYAHSPAPTEIVLTLLSHEGQGAASADLIAAVRVAFGLTADGTAQGKPSKIRPQGDRVTVQSAEIITYTIEAQILLQPGPAPATVVDAAHRAISDYTETQRALGAGITLSGIHRALHQPGATNVAILQPPSDIPAEPEQSCFCTEIVLTSVIVETET